jgi:mRNA-degrading endonuclease RelE of RelBE toxin-antitoxin system
VTYRIRFTRRASKDIKQLRPKEVAKLKEILRTRIAVDPHAGKALVGDLKGCYSVRLNYHDRIIYTIHDDELLVLVLRTRTHYGE